MTLRSALPLAGSIAAALAVTTAAYLVDIQRQHVHDTAAGLKWARQVASQAEGMLFTARSRGEQDPLGWVIDYLSQGAEPRAIRVSKVEELSGQPETYSLDRSTQILDYVRILSPENGTGIRVKLQMPYTGFLGARTAVWNDFAAVAFFGVTLALILGATRRGHRRGSDVRMRKLVVAWLKEAKTLLTQLGINIRELVREAQNLAVAAGKSRNAMSELRNRIHGQMREIHETRESLKEATRTAVQAEVATLNLVLEASRMGEHGKRMAGLAEELHKHVQKLRKVNGGCEEMMGKVEVQMEPWATDADIAYHSYDDVFRATQGMDGHIKNTTASILDQARMIQSLGGEMSGQTPADEVPGRRRA
jgi:hypothetical protein